MTQWLDPDGQDCPAAGRRPARLDAAAGARPSALLARWRAAEAAAWPALLAATAAIVRLDERLRSLPESLRRTANRRLALRQAAAFAWACGTPVAPERLALEALGAAGRADAAALAAARAGWAARRLAADRWRLRDAVGDRRSTEGRADEDRLATGLDPEAARAWLSTVGRLGALQPVTRAVAAERLLRQAAVTSGGGPLRAAVAAAKLAARAGTGALGFAPTPPRRRVRGADDADWLAAACADFADGAGTALAHVDDFLAWRARALAASADLAGPSPSLLIGALSDRIAVTSRDAARAAGVSGPSARRGLRALEACGLVREITGQTRYRIWTAAGLPL